MEIKKNSFHLGKSGEETAVLFLKKTGYLILERNYRNRFGEIDVIAKDGDFLVFVEVKTRKSFRCGKPFESVDYRKQRQISKVALDYISRNDEYDRPARFDVIAVTLQKNNQAKVDIIRNAFEFVGPTY